MPQLILHFQFEEITIWKYKHTITVDERFFDVQKLKNLIISKTWNTWIIYLKDIAVVEEAPVKEPLYLDFHQNEIIYKCSYSLSY